jgi:hypothetical protein
MMLRKWYCAFGSAEFFQEAFAASALLAVIR